MFPSHPSVVEDRRRTIFGLLSDTRYRRVKLKFSKRTFEERIWHSLLEENRLYDKEDWLWDYKRCLPVKPHPYRRGTDPYKNYNSELCEITKDIVAFYNTAGGVLIFGIDNDGSIIGCSTAHKTLVDDLNRKIESTTKIPVDFQWKQITSSEKKLYLIIVPRRKTATPLSFNSAATAPANNPANRAFGQGDVYFRKNDQCVPSSSLSNEEQDKFNSGAIHISGLKLSSLNDRKQYHLTRWAVGLCATLFVVLGVFYYHHHTRCELPNDRIAAILSGHSKDFKFLQSAKDHICSIHARLPNLTDQELTEFVLTFRDKWEVILSSDIDQIERTHSVSLGIIRSALADDGFEEADSELRALERMTGGQIGDSVSYLSDLHLLRASLALHINGDLDRAAHHIEAAAEYFDEVDDRKAFLIRMEAASRILAYNRVFPGDGAIIAEALIRRSIDRSRGGIDVPTLANATSLLGSALAELGDEGSLERSVNILDFALEKMREDSDGWKLTRVNLINALVTLKEHLRWNANKKGVEEVRSRLRQAGAYESGTLEFAARLSGESHFEWLAAERQNSTDDTWRQFELSTTRYLKDLELVLGIYESHEFYSGLWVILNDLGFANYRLSYRGFRSKSGSGREQYRDLLEKAVDAFQSAIVIASTVYGDANPMFYLAALQNLCLARIEQGWALDLQEAESFYRDVAVPTCENVEEVAEMRLHRTRPEPWVYMYIRLARIELDRWARDRSQADALEGAVATSSLAAKYGEGVVGTTARLLNCTAFAEQQGVALWPISDKSLSELRDNRIRSILLQFESCQGLLGYVGEYGLKWDSHEAQPS